MNYIIFGRLTTIINLLVYYLLTNSFLDSSVELELQIANYKTIIIKKYQNTKKQFTNI